MGLIHHSFNLSPGLSVAQNIALPMLLEGHRLRHVSEEIDSLLSQLGLGNIRERALDQLSGGELQRISIARALLVRPDLILADEPTGRLDSRIGAETLEGLRRESLDRRITTVLVTHDMQVTSYADRVVSIRDGRVQEDTRPVVRALE